MLRRHNQMQKAHWHSKLLQSISNPAFPWNPSTCRPSKSCAKVKASSTPTVSARPKRWAAARKFSLLMLPVIWSSTCSSYTMGKPLWSEQKRAILLEEHCPCLSLLEVKRLGMSLRKSAGTTCMYHPVCIYNALILIVTNLHMLQATSHGLQPCFEVHSQASSNLAKEPPEAATNHFTSVKQQTFSSPRKERSASPNKPETIGPYFQLIPGCLDIIPHLLRIHQRSSTDEASNLVHTEYSAGNSSTHVI